MNECQIESSLSNIAIELSRRGYVVALIDPYAQGMSSSALSTRAAPTEGYGMFSLVKYFFNKYCKNISMIVNNFLPNFKRIFSTYSSDSFTN